MKKSFHLILGIGVLLLFAASFNLAQGPYFVSIPGTGFVGVNASDDYHYINGWVYKPASPGVLGTRIIFPDDLKYIERMSITYYDFTTTGELQIHLWKQNRWTGQVTSMALCKTGGTFASNDTRTTSVILGPGRGINNANYSYFVWATFTESSASLRLFQVTFKCQPH